MDPLISILIPTHRPEHFVNALNCALNQTYSKKEIIISDNSNDGQIKALCGKFHGVKYFKNTDGRAISNIVNPLNYASGDYIKYLFDDDLLFPHCLGSMVEELTEFGHEDVVLITSSRQLINSKSKVTSHLALPQIEKSSLFYGSDALKRMLMNADNFIGELSTVMFKRPLVTDLLFQFHEIGFDFSDGLGIIDVVLYYLLLSPIERKMLYIPFDLSAFRQHENSESNPLITKTFHTAVSGWIKLIELAYSKGHLNDAEATIACENYLKLSLNYVNLFPEHLYPWEDRAKNLIAKLACSN